MATHIEICNVEFNDGKNRLCLDKVIRDDANGEIEFAFVWRGTSVSKDAFNPRPAYFDWKTLGELIIKAYSEGGIDKVDFHNFTRTINSGIDADSPQISG